MPTQPNTTLADHGTQQRPDMDPLRSEDPKIVAEALSDLLARATGAELHDHEAEHPKNTLPNPGQRLEGTLQRMKQLVMHPSLQDNGLRGPVKQAIIVQEFTKPLTTALAHMGHINEMSALIARDNLLRNMHQQGLSAPGGIRELMERFPDADTATQSLAKPTFWLTLTAHPTSTNALSSLQAQRALLRAIDRYRDSDSTSTADIYKAMRDFVSVPVIPMKEGKAVNLTVPEETAQTLYALENIYHDVPHVYKRYDESLKERFTDYDPATLDLNIRFSSWGSSGDKDGNANVSADTTLHAMGMHRLAALRCYGKDLKDTTHEGLAPWAERIDTKQAALEQWVSEFNAAYESAPRETAKDGKPGKPHLSPEQFDAFSARLKDISQELDSDAFLRDINAAYSSSKDKSLLDLSRRARIFSFNFGRLEYRETALEYGRIAGLLIPGYDEIEESAREAALNELLALSPEALQARAKDMHASTQAAWGKAYTPEDANPIGYQTLKRMELARDFPDMVTDNVLAECQDTSNFLEALLMQRLAAKDGAAPKLGIIPLFEDRHALDKCTESVARAWANPHYGAHMESLGKVQQVQLAHSDNARRSGMPAARAYIYEAHQKLRELGAQHGVTMQFFEGGSQSDPYRGGIRSLTSTIKEFGIQDFAKFTFQGGDLLNYLNYTPSVMRLFTRIISHCAESIYKRDQQAAEPGKFTQRLAGEKEPNGVDPELDSMAIKSLKLTAIDYENRIYKDPDFNQFMKLIGYVEESSAGGAMSRGGKGRKGDHVDIDDMRTISFSETLQHAGITPTWIGAANLNTHLYHANGKEMTPKTLHALYEKSPVFRDVTDRILFGLAKTDLDALQKGPAAKSPVVDELTSEYRRAYRLAMEARTGIPHPHIRKDKDGNDLSCTDLRDSVINEALPHLKDDLGTKMRYLGLVNEVKRHVLLTDQQVEDYHQALKTGGKNPEDKAYIEDRLENDASLRRLVHNAGDTVHHGRYLMADDNNYGLYRMALEKVRAEGATDTGAYQQGMDRYRENLANGNGKASGRVAA